MTDTSETGEGIATDSFGTLLAGNVGTVANKLIHLDDGQLRVLHDLEAGGENRVTLLAAIDDEIARREAAGNGSGGDGTGDGDQGDGASDGTGNGDAGDGDQGDAAAQGGAMVEEGAPKLYTQAQLDQVIADAAEGYSAELAKVKDSHAAEIEALKSDHATALAKEKAAKPKADKIAATPRVEPIDLSMVAANPADAAKTGGTHVVFVDGSDVPLVGLTPLAFGPADFLTDDGGGALLVQPVTFPREGPRGEAHAAVLMVDDKAVGVARLVMPFGVCGGQGSEIPARSLRFIAAV